MKKSRISRPCAVVESPATRTLPLVDLLVDTKAEFVELMVRSGLRVLDAMLEEDRTRSVVRGMRMTRPAPPRARARWPARSCWAGRKVRAAAAGARRRPRGALPTFQTLAAQDPLNRRVARADAGRRHHAAVCAEPGAAPGGRAESRHEQEQREPPLRGADHRATAGVADRAPRRPRSGRAADRRRAHRRALSDRRARDRRRRAETRARPLGRATENATVCRSLLANLQGRGLRTDRSLLVILDGALALHKAVRMVFGEAALIQRCQVHKLRNISTTCRSGSVPRCRPSSAAPIRPPTSRRRRGS